jgi:hypothetical protein
MLSENLSGSVGQTDPQCELNCALRQSVFGCPPVIQLPPERRNEEILGQPNAC